MKKTIILTALLFGFYANAQIESATPTIDYCAKVTTETDKFTGDVTSQTEMAMGNFIMKVTSNGKSKYLLRLNVLSPTAASGKKGAIVLLANGKKIERPNADVIMDANFRGKSFRYNAILELTPADLKLLTDSPITDVRLYIFDGDPLDGTKLMEQTKCLIKLATK